MDIKGVFTLTQPETETGTNKKWVGYDYVEVFTLNKTDTVTDANRFQTHFIGLSLGLGLCLSLSVSTPRRILGCKMMVSTETRLVNI